MQDISGQKWYVIRTKPRREIAAVDWLQYLGVEGFVPLMRRSSRRFGRNMSIVEPLFPGYLFALFYLDVSYYSVVHSPGVHSVVRVGGEPAAIAAEVVEELKDRVREGPLELNARSPVPGGKVTILNGPLEGLEAVFESFLSGTQRVAVLLNYMQREGIRVTLPAESVA